MGTLVIDSGAAPPRGEDSGLRILVADDDPLSLKLLEWQVNQGGYEVVSANTGREAFVLADLERPRVIVMGIMLQATSRLEVLRELKRRESTKEIPVIVICASCDPVVLAEAWNAGAAVVLTKPLNGGKVVEAIRRLLS